MERAHGEQPQFDDDVRKTAGGAGAAEIDRAKAPLDRGAITATEFHVIKQKALA
jgi:hypothetical protein